MTDAERDIIDMESEKIIMICNQYVNDLKRNVLKSTIAQSNEQFIQHKLAILEILSHYLKNIFQMHNEQKQNRIQHEMDTPKLLKLESNDKTSSNKMNGFKNDIVLSKSEKNINTSKLRKDDILTTNINTPVKKNEDPQKVAIDEDQAKLSFENENSNAEDIQLFESENTQLLHELKGLTDEVDQIEKNVVDIAKLQEIFTEKVTSQKHDIERIGNVVVGATENIKDANEQIKQAIQRNAGLRVWVLFFLIVMSFTLLFLDWYND